MEHSVYQDLGRLEGKVDQVLTQLTSNHFMLIETTKGLELRVRLLEDLKTRVMAVALVVSVVGGVLSSLAAPLLKHLALAAQAAPSIGH